MGTEDELLSVIAEIYDSATDPRRMADLGAFLARQFGTDSAILYLARKPNPHLELAELVSATQNFDTWALSSYAEYYHQKDEFFARGMRRGALRACIGQELIDEVSFGRTELCADWCKRTGWFHVTGALALVDDLIGGIGLHKPRQAGPFSEADRSKLQLLLPHLQRAWQIRHRLALSERERGVALDLIDGLGIGIVVVAASGRALFVNRIADRVLRGGRGLSLRNDRLRSQDRRRQQNLERLIGEAAGTSAGKGTSAGGTLSLPRMEGPPLVLLVSPFRSTSIGYGPARPAAVVTFSDPDKPSAVSEEVLRTAYDLTRAQARLLAAILRGQNLTDYAEAAGISINTAKTLMQRVFHKTGSSRQADLISAVAGDPLFKLTAER